MTSFPSRRRSTSTPFWRSRKLTRPIFKVDVDDVCADLISEWVRRYNEAWGDNLTPANIIYWNLANCVKPECGQQVYDILRQPDLYDNVRPIPGAKWGVEQLRRIGRVVFVTAVVPGTLDAKLEWLYRNGFITRDSDFIAAKDKSLVDGDVLIDDAPHNHPDILFSRTHNQGFHHPFRAHDWDEIVSLVPRLFDTSGMRRAYGNL